MSPRLVISAYHCTLRHNETTLCDHSGGERIAILGEHDIHKDDIWKYKTIPIIKVLAPQNGHWRKQNKDSHDFAMLVLKYPVKIKPRIGPICLPEANSEFGGKKAIATGVEHM